MFFNGVTGGSGGIFDTPRTVLPNFAVSTTTQYICRMFLMVRAMASSARVAGVHAVNNNRMIAPFPDNMHLAMFGMGCFWGVEKKFWEQKGVYSTQVGYAGGRTENPTYASVCAGQTGHAEVVRVIYNPEVIDYQTLLKIFWENHDPTQGMRQWADVGEQYRSVLYTYSQDQHAHARSSLDAYQKGTRKKEIPVGREETARIASMHQYQYHQSTQKHQKHHKHHKAPKTPLGAQSPWFLINTTKQLVVVFTFSAGPMFFPTSSGFMRPIWT
uniref:peptide methionine sulfoxide reductase MsrA-like isoform X1 n=1 Tax=Myxine glutinosa TaxID=7769 RepID=UPI00358FF722